MTKKETLRIMKIIDNESKGFMPDNDADAELKLETWFAMLQSYEYNKVQIATMKMLARFKYGTAPKIGDLFGVLAPEKEKENIGAEFADRFMSLVSSKGTENMGDYILQEFGEIGFQIWRDNKSYVREMSMDEIPTFKAQIRNSYNSMNERKELGTLEALPFKSNSVIMKNLRAKGLILLAEENTTKEIGV